MDKLAHDFLPPGRIDLAREADFMIGPLLVRPSRCKAEGLGAQQILQRRVMQVLVALAQANAEVVSPHELIKRCWGGLLVSEDAIGRCIAQLRRLAAAFPEPPFSIENVAGVGYRLIPSAPRGLDPGHETQGPRRWLLIRPRIGAAAVIAVLLVVATVVWIVMGLGDTRTPRLMTPVVEVRPFNVIGDEPSLKPFAARAADEISGFLGDSNVRVAAGPTAKAQLAFLGAVSGDAGELRLHLVLQDTGSGTTIWSRDFKKAAARSDALVGEAEGGAMESINTTRAFYGTSGPLMDPDTAQLIIRGVEDEAVPTFANADDAVRAFEQALAHHPSEAGLRTAYASALLSVGQNAPPPERAQMLERAHAEAERVVRENPQHPGLAPHVLALIQRARAPRDWVGAEATLDAALKAAPDEAFVLGDKCGFLLSVGRAADSLYYCQRALSLRPHTALFLQSYGQALDMQGDHPDFADRLLAEGSRHYPAYLGLRVYRFAKEAFAGSPDRALALLHDPDTAPPISPEEVRAIELLEKARKTGSTVDANAAMAAMRSSGAHDPQDEFRFLFPMALGRLDEAFAVPDTAVMEESESILLVLHFTERLRRDARYWPVAARAGLVRYWLTTNKWPDFCSDPTYPLDCRTQARRVAAPALAAS